MLGAWAASVWLLSCGPATQNTQNAIPPAEASQRHYALGVDYFQKQMVPAANSELAEALRLDPANYEAHYMAGLIAMQQAVESVEMTSRVRCLPPAEAKLDMDDANQKMRQAEAAFHKAVELHPDYSEAWNALSAVAMHFQRWDQVIETAGKALENGGYRTPWLALGNQGIGYLNKKDYPRAARAFHQALMQDSKFCVAHWRLGEVYQAQGDDDQAIRELQMVVSDKQCPIQEAYLLIGKLLQKKNETEQAAEMFRQCVRLAPESCLAKECRLAN